MSPMPSLLVAPTKRCRIQYTDITALIYTKDRTDVQTLKLRRQVQDLALKCGVFSGFVKASSIVILLEYDNDMIGYLLVQDNSDLSFALLPKYAQNDYLKYGFITSCLRFLDKDKVFWDRNVCTITPFMFGTQITTQTGDSQDIVSSYMISYKAFNAVWEMIAKPQSKLFITSEYISPCSEEKIVSLYRLGSKEKHPLFTHTGLTSEDRTLVVSSIGFTHHDKDEAIAAYCDHVLTVNPNTFVLYENDVFVRRNDMVWRIGNTNTYGYDAALIDAYKERLYKRASVCAEEAMVKDPLDGV